MSRPTRVLCVDDEPVILRTLQAVLKSGGFETLAACSPQEAIDVLSHEDVDVVILDYGVAQFNGSSVVEKMKALRRGVRVFLHSGDFEVAHNLPSGIDGFIPKPEHPSNLLRIVAAAA